MLVNPGGPGGSGLGAVDPRAVRPQPRRRRVRLDRLRPPRRRVEQAGAVLQAELLPPDRPSYVPTPQSLINTWLDRCRKNYAGRVSARAQPALLQHIKTIDSAKDMESIRLALGAHADQLLRLLLRHLPRPGLQHAVPDARAADGARHQRRPAPGLVRRQPRTRTSPSTATSTSGSAGWRSTTASTTSARPRRPSTTSGTPSSPRSPRSRPAASSGRTSGPTSSCAPATTSRPGPTWATSSPAGCTSTTSHAAADRLRGTADTPGDDNGYAVYDAVQCTDVQWPQSWATLGEGQLGGLPEGTVRDLGQRLVQRAVPVLAGQGRHAGEGRRQQGRSALLIDETLDAATPYEGSLEVRQLLPARVAARAARRHLARQLAVTATPARTTRSRRYLADGTLPARRAGNNTADAFCAPLPQPVPTSGAAIEAAPLQKVTGSTATRPQLLLTRP